MQRRASFRRRNKCASIYDSIFEESQTLHLFPAGFAHAATRNEIAFDESVKNYRKRHFFPHILILFCLAENTDIILKTV